MRLCTKKHILYMEGCALCSMGAALSSLTVSWAPNARRTMAKWRSMRINLRHPAAALKELDIDDLRNLF